MTDEKVKKKNKGKNPKLKEQRKKRIKKIKLLGGLYERKRT